MRHARAWQQQQPARRRAKPSQACTRWRADAPPSAAAAPLAQDGNWTHEQGIVAGPRVTHADMAALLAAQHAPGDAQPHSVLLVAELPEECAQLVGARTHTHTHAQRTRRNRLVTHSFSRLFISRASLASAAPQAASR
jgi:hypothetical protein